MEVGCVLVLGVAVWPVLLTGARNIHAAAVGWMLDVADVGCTSHIIRTFLPTVRTRNSNSVGCRCYDRYGTYWFGVGCWPVLDSSSSVGYTAAVRCSLHTRYVRTPAACGVCFTHNSQQPQQQQYVVRVRGSRSISFFTNKNVVLLCTSKCVNMTQAQNRSSITVGVELNPGDRGGERGSVPEGRTA